MPVSKNVVIGLGNTILRDDGVGVFAARKVQDLLPEDAGVDVVEAALAGFNLLDLIIGFEKAIIIDSIQTKDGKVGDIYEFTPDAIKHTVRLASIHDMNLVTALEFGKMMGMDVPHTVNIYAIEVADNSNFGEEMCPEVEEAVPTVVEKVIKDLKL